MKHALLRKIGSAFFNQRGFKTLKIAYKRLLKPSESLSEERESADFLKSRLYSSLKAKNLERAAYFLQFKNLRKSLNEEDELAFKLACANGSVDIARDLLKIKSIKKKLLKKRDPYFSQACQNGEASVVDTLLKINIFRNKVTQQGNRALEDACLGGHLTIVKKLMEIPAVKKKAITKSYYTLYFACMSGNPALVDFLLENNKIKKAASEADNYILRQVEIKIADARTNNKDYASFEKIQQKLLAIPSVAEYEKTVGWETALHREGAMFRNAGESTVITVLNKLYGKLLPTSEAVDKTIEDIKKYLRDEYYKEPVIGDNGQALPIIETEEEYKKLSKSEKVRFHEHPMHTAWRLFIQPHNFWLSKRGYFNVTTLNGVRYCSTNIPPAQKRMIALSWIALHDDENRLPHWTLENTKRLYAIDLAQIQRAHNWDKAKGKEFDDPNIGDNPSCGPGVERRLIYAISLSNKQLHTPGLRELNEASVKDKCWEMIVGPAFDEWLEKNDPALIDEEALLAMVSPDLFTEEEMIQIREKLTLPFTQKQKENFIKSCETWWTPDRLYKTIFNTDKKRQFRELVSDALSEPYNFFMERIKSRLEEINKKQKPAELLSSFQSKRSSDSFVSAQPNTPPLPTGRFRS